MECKQATNKQDCACTYGCSRSGKCCECVRHHRAHGQFPACFFSKEAEARSARSFEELVLDRSGK